MSVQKTSLLLLILSLFFINNVSAQCCGNDDVVNATVVDDEALKSSTFMQAMQDPKMRAFFETLSPDDQRVCREFCRLFSVIIQRTQEDIIGLVEQPEFNALLEQLKKHADISKLELRIELRNAE